MIMEPNSRYTYSFINRDGEVERKNGVYLGAEVSISPKFETFLVFRPINKAGPKEATSFLNIVSITLLPEEY
jgi:hypothetical protein